MAETAKTSANLRMRSEPGTNYDILDTLPKGTRVTILEQPGIWYKVTARNRTGWVHSGYLILDDHGVDEGFLVDVLDFNTLPLAPAQRVPTGSNSNEKRVARAWNSFGGLLTELDNRLKIEPYIAAAVLAIESSGRGFTNGKMIIRFENHKFYKYWGRANASQFNAHFRFNAEKRWQGHEWRQSSTGAWQSFHGKQGAEWEVFNFAAGLDDTAAKLSISMGLPQIMGFNYTSIGYESVQDMYDAFVKGEAQQIVGFFDFVQGPEGNDRKIVALQRKDFTTFAAHYNGSGQAAKYADWIEGAYEALQGLAS